MNTCRGGVRSKVTSSLLLLLILPLSRGFSVLSRRWSALICVRRRKRILFSLSQSLLNCFACNLYCISFRLTPLHAPKKNEACYKSQQECQVLGTFKWCKVTNCPYFLLFALFGINYQILDIERFPQCASWNTLLCSRCWTRRASCLPSQEFMTEPKRRSCGREFWKPIVYLSFSISTTDLTHQALTLIRIPVSSAWGNFQRIPPNVPNPTDSPR